MIESKNITIGDTIYKVSQLGGVSSSRTFVRLAKFVAATSGGNLEKLFSVLTEEDVTYFCELFSAQTLIQKIGSKSAARLSDEGVFDMHFAGDKIGQMIEWLKFCILLNFGSAFRGLVGAAERGAEKAAESSSTPQTGSTGSSIES